MKQSEQQSRPLLPIPVVSRRRFASGWANPSSALAFARGERVRERGDLTVEKEVVELRWTNKLLRGGSFFRNRAQVPHGELMRYLDSIGSARV